MSSARETSSSTRFARAASWALLVLACFAALRACAVPAPLARCAEPSGTSLRPASSDPRAIEVQGEHGLRVVADAHGLSIEAADGGGAGRVDGVGPASAPLELRVVRAGSSWIAARRDDASGWACVRFDERGVREDDGLVARAAASWGSTSIAAATLLLALVLRLRAR